MSEQAIRHHHLKAIARAPALGRFALQGGTVEEEDETDDGGKRSRDIEVGAATHNIVFNTKPVVVAPMARNEKHKAYQEFMAANPGAQIVTDSIYDDASRVADAIRGHREVAPLLDGAVFEETLYFERLGVKCRATPDIRHDERVVLAELKSTKSAAPWEFKRDAEKRWYHAQMAMQRRACIEALGYDPDCYLIAVEKTPPFLVTVLRLTEGTLSEGEDLIDEALRTLIDCRRTGHWPGYAEGVLDWDTPTEGFRSARAA